MLYRSPDPLPWVFYNSSVFVAGGISNCPDWQSEMVSSLDVQKFDVVNPRRVGGFDTTGASAREQITWEHTALSKVDAVLFWFPKETLCPITLFELGVMMERVKRNPTITVIVGWHPEYQRAFDLEVQIGLVGHRAQISHAAPGWDALMEAARSRWG